ncbi:MAG: TIGR01212 family radical SAM protein [Lachnospiraceae bacterium]|jgi:radical SAM protein (TIGR01212 family)|nr:TIGR01212 family radical SAM protein [Lachnospiraceae bacterium]
MNHYYSFNRYIRQAFGQKLYKLSLNGGMSCPNRDGTLGTSGCIFCSAGGSGDFASNPQLSVDEQIKAAAALVSRKARGGPYIAYFQAYTNTYAPLPYLEALFTQAIQHPDIAALSIGTRPDCLPEPVLDLLERLSHIKPVWVELGLQTIHAHTAAYIRRGYDLPVFDQAVHALQARGLSVIVHLILGLPGESPDDMVQSAAYVSAALARQNLPQPALPIPPASGVKLQLLHVLQGTDLAADYKKGLFKALSMEDYFAILFRCLEVLPPSLVIHRLTGDGPKSLLIAPQWSANKKLVLGAMQRAMDEADVQQGRLAQWPQ